MYILRLTVLFPQWMFRVHSVCSCRREANLHFNPPCVINRSESTLLFRLSFVLRFMTPDRICCDHWNDLGNLYLNLTKEWRKHVTQFHHPQWKPAGWSQGKMFPNVRNVKCVAAGRQPAVSTSVTSKQTHLHPATSRLVNVLLRWADRSQCHLSLQAGVYCLYGTTRLRDRFRASPVSDVLNI